MKEMTLNAKRKVSNGFERWMKASSGSKHRNEDVMALNAEWNQVVLWTLNCRQVMAQNAERKASNGSEL